MIKIYYKGKIRRILSMQRGSEDIGAWYDAKKAKIWPDDSARSNALRVKLPEKGTEAWAYWVHAVDALRNLGASDDCFLCLIIDGKRYYIIDSPDGSEPLQVEGNALYFSGDGDFPTEGVGATVSVRGFIPHRCGGKRWTEWDERTPEGCQYNQWDYLDKQKYDKVVTAAPDWFDVQERIIYSTWRGLLPILPNTRFPAVTSKMQQEQNVRFMFRVSGVDSGAVYCERKAFEIGGRGERDVSNSLKDESYEAERHVWVNNGNVYHAPDTGFSVEMWTYSTGNQKKSGMCVVHPQFSKTWELEVESINEMAL